MNSKRIALVRYAPDYFLPFGRALEHAGFEVYWINALRSDSTYLRRHGVSDTRALDTSSFDPAAYSYEECRSRLSRLEVGDAPRINDIILMDRILRRRGYEDSIKYLGHLEKIVSRFLQDNAIALVTSGRDTALQILSMLVCRRLGIPWVVPTRSRIPQEMYGFCQRHDTEGMLRLREVTSHDREWAARLLKEFSNKSLRPAMKKSARGFGDVLRLLPLHAMLFIAELRKSLFDRGNRYARYTILGLIRMYVRRRVNMVMYKSFRPFAAVGKSPFCLYALHTQPESSIDVVGSYFSDQIALITFLVRSLPVTHELYVKVHPTDVDGKELSFYRKVTAIPGVRLISDAVDSRELVSRASLVFSLSGTIAYEAGLFGKPAIVLARNFFNSLPTLRYCDSPPRLPALVMEMIDTSPPPGLHDRVIDFLANLRACTFDGEVNRTYGTSMAPLSDRDLDSLLNAYNSLLLYFGTVRREIRCSQ